MNLVAECTTMSASIDSGCWSRGVAKVLSTTTYAPASCAAATIAGMSATSSAGLVGRLQPHQRGVVAGLHDGVGVGDVDQQRADAAARLQVGQLHDAAVVGVPRRDHGAALTDQVEDGRDRGEPGGERQAPPALEVAERLLERRPGRVAVAAVLRVAPGDVRRGHRQRHVQRVVRVVRGTPGRDRDGGGTVGRRGPRRLLRLVLRLVGRHASSLGTADRNAASGRVGSTHHERAEQAASPVNGTRRPRIAVVFGGRSSEHGISCVTAGSVLRAIDPERYDVVPVGITLDGQWVLESADPTRLAITSRDGLPEVDGSRATVALAQQDRASELVVHEPSAVPAHARGGRRRLPAAARAVGRGRHHPGAAGDGRRPVRRSGRAGLARSAWTSTT